MSLLNNRGLTFVELIVVIVMSSFLAIIISTFIVRTFTIFFDLQTQGLAQSKVTDASFRISKVFRGITYIENAEANTITGYTYFAPNDQYTSKITYYLNSSTNKVMAEVTPMTADYPIGSLLNGEKRTVTIIDNYYPVNGLSLFQYYNANYDALSAPVTDKQSIKNITVNLQSGYNTNKNNGKYTSSSISVNLRNRKTNL